MPFQSACEEQGGELRDLIQSESPGKPKGASRVVAANAAGVKAAADDDRGAGNHDHGARL